MSILRTTLGAVIILLGAGVSYAEDYSAPQLPGNTDWRADIERRQEHRRDLWFALQTRRLSDEEMKEVQQYGKLLNIEDGVAYYEREKTAELQRALFFQAGVRAQAKAPR